MAKKRITFLSTASPPPQKRSRKLARPGRGGDGLPPGAGLDQGPEIFSNFDNSEPSALADYRCAIRLLIES
jgi:hypothetical protein